MLFVCSPESRKRGFSRLEVFAFPFPLLLKELCVDDGKTTTSGLKAVVTALLKADKKKSAALLGANDADKQLVWSLLMTDT